MKERLKAGAVRPIIPRSHLLFADIIHWLTIMSCLLALFTPVLVVAEPDNNLLNPNLLFTAIFNKATPTEIWSLSKTGDFPGAHFYFKNMGWGDSWAMIAIALGCSVGLWALLPTIFFQFYRERDRLYGYLGGILACLMALSVCGILIFAT